MDGAEFTVGLPIEINPGAPLFVSSETYKAVYTWNPEFERFEIALYLSVTPTTPQESTLEIIRRAAVFGIAVAAVLIASNLIMSFRHVLPSS